VGSCRNKEKLNSAEKRNLLKREGRKVGKDAVSLWRTHVEAKPRTRLNDRGVRDGGKLCQVHTSREREVPQSKEDVRYVSANAKIKGRKDISPTPKKKEELKEKGCKD